jgi:V8-like Glu-specific endopeptidase
MADSAPASENAAFDEAAALAAAIARHVPITILAEIVGRLGIDPEFGIRRREASSDPTTAKLQLAQHAVSKAMQAGAAAALAGELASRLHLDDLAFAELAAFAHEDKNNLTKEAAIAKRANTMALEGLGQSVEQWKAWLCIIAVELPTEVVRGTGFLVGPDLVLTAWHTVRDHAGAQRMIAIFDHCKGNPVGTLDRLNEMDVRQVAFHEHWRVADCIDLPEDGVLPDPEPMSQNDHKLRQGSLDFALLRLAEPVGAQARNPAFGGPPRGWLRLQPPSAAVANDERIIIPQHPTGHPQRVDFGRFGEFDKSETRLRYNTETAPGSSGAPCFDRLFRLVGIHNAKVVRNNVTVGNQAIRLELILAKLQQDAKARGLLEAAATPPKEQSVIWNASPAATAPRVILGRQKLIPWIATAATEAPADRSTRVYAAAANALSAGTTTGFGKSFSIEILRSARRLAAEYIVVLGTKEAELPATALDVITAIAIQLGIPSEELKQIPPRPALDPADGQAGSSDKLSLWASVELPTWFDGVLARHRQYTRDLTDQARFEIQGHTERGEEVPDRLLRQLEAGGTVTVSRWKYAWIAIDQLGSGGIADEVKNLLAGLTGSNLPEASVRPELRRLRWLFLSLVPDFLGRDVTIELLDPMEITADHCVAPMQQMAAALRRKLSDDYIRGLRDTWETILAPGAPFDDPHRRLALIQDRLARFVPVVQKSIRQTQPLEAGQ